MKVKPVTLAPAGEIPDSRATILRSIESVDALSPSRPARAFRRPWWLFSAHLETLYSVRLCERLSVEYEHQEAITPDTDVVLFHYIRGERNRPLLVVFHGLEGSSSSPSVKLLAHHFSSRLGWSVVVPHFRTCGAMNRLPRAYHAGDADEVSWMVKYAVNLVSATRAHAVGISLGGNALAKWLGTRRQSHLASAATVCAPFDLSLCCDRLERMLNRRIYGDHFLESLLQKVEAKMRQYPFLLDGKRAKKIRTIRQFDDAYTAPVHGYGGASDYYARASAKRDLPNVSTRLLCINPLNDPLVPAASVPGHGEMPPCVQIEKPRHGGHLGFVEGRKQTDWLPERLEAFFCGK